MGNPKVGDRFVDENKGAMYRVFSIQKKGITLEELETRYGEEIMVKLLTFVSIPTHLVEYDAARHTPVNLLQARLLNELDDKILCKIFDHERLYHE